MMQNSLCALFVLITMSGCTPSPATPANEPTANAAADNKPGDHVNSV